MAAAWSQWWALTLAAYDLTFSACPVANASVKTSGQSECQLSPVWSVGLALKCGDIFSEYLKFPTKKMRVKCVKPPERQIQKSMRKQDRGNLLPTRFMSYLTANISSTPGRNVRETSGYKKSSDIQDYWRCCYWQDNYERSFELQPE